MKYNYTNPRPLEARMGTAVAKRTVLRENETWKQVANRVARGNCLLTTKLEKGELRKFRNHIANASILLSGRHLQHGDNTQPMRNQEVFTNCSTASTTFAKYYLLLNGSGVGRCYDDDLMVVDWSKMPFIHCVLDEEHADYDFKVHESLEHAKHKYGKSDVIHYQVGDSREGWGKLIEYLEFLAFEGKHADSIVLVDFSKVRPKGAPIKGMQNRPSSGPVPLMNAINIISSLKGTLIPLWKQAMYVDHYLAESVLVGGARRSARIAIKYWRDPGILEFIALKGTKFNGSAPLWSSNNSVAVDATFWAECEIKGTWANRVFDAVCKAAYYDGTGEPGLLNIDKLKQDSEGMADIVDGFKKRTTLGKKKYEVTHGYVILERTASVVYTKKYYMCPNPCGEITLSMLGAYCVIGDVVPFHTENQKEFEDACKLTARALMRTNLMPCLYQGEVNRTNRIGVSLTGVHEWAWKRFGFSFLDLLDEEKSSAFWSALASARDAIITECWLYAQKLGVSVPHTCLTVKPAGTTSKLFGLSEGVHLPSMREFVRWVQFRNDDPLVAKYQKLGYQTRELKAYKGTVIVGFPTQPVICTLGMGKKLMTASEATPDQQFQWLRLLEKHWLGTEKGNQLSYTLKYDKAHVSYKQFKEMLYRNMPSVKCVSVMPFSNSSSYEYMPEEAVTLEEYNKYIANVKEELEGDIDRAHVECAGGACPIDVKEKK